MSRFLVTATIATAGVVSAMTMAMVTVAPAALAAGCDLGEDCCSGSSSGSSTSTSLLGPHACGALTCGDGEVCVTYYAGLDAGDGSGEAGSCMSVPALCRIEDCGRGTECAPCLQQLCYEQTFTVVSGRDVSCAGQ